MIRPNLLCLVSAVAFLLAASSSACAQHGPQFGPGHPPLIQLPQSNCPAPIVDHYSQGHPRLWDEEQPIEKFLTEVTSRSWLKMEFLMWNYSAPGDNLIGAPVTGLQFVVPNNSLQGIDVPIDVNDNLNGGNSVGATLFPTMVTIGGQDVPGIRGTWGVALNDAELEMSFFGLEQSGDSLFINNIAGPRDLLFALDPLNNPDPSLGTTFNPNYAIPLLTDGAVTDVAAMNALIFNDSLQAEQRTQVWGSEISLLTDKDFVGNGPSWQWLGGFRYVSLDEEFSVNGTFNGRGLVADRTTTIRSHATNHIYGPEIGGRAAINTRWFTLSATPRVMFGLNDHTTSVNANPLGTGATRFGSNTVDFGTITQLNLSGEVHLNRHFSVYGGYDFMWLPRVTRPQNNIVYNSTTAAGGGFTPDIRENVNFSNFVAQGISIGAVFRY